MLFSGLFMAGLAAISVTAAPYHAHQPRPSILQPRLAMPNLLPPRPNGRPLPVEPHTTSPYQPEPPTYPQAPKAVEPSPSLQMSAGADVDVPNMQMTGNADLDLAGMQASGTTDLDLPGMQASGDINLDLGDPLDFNGRRPANTPYRPPSPHAAASVVYKPWKRARPTGFPQA